MNAYLSHTRGAQQLRTLLLRLPLGLANAVAGVAYLAVAASSLVPKALRPTTGIVPGFAEHFAAYFVLGAVAVLAWKTRTPLWRLAVIHASLAAVLEVAQTAVQDAYPRSRTLPQVHWAVRWESLSWRIASTAVCGPAAGPQAQHDAHHQTP